MLVQILRSDPLEQVAILCDINFIPRDVPCTACPQLWLSGKFKKEAQEFSANNLKTDIKIRYATSFIEATAVFVLLCGKWTLI
jgi:hypothetical protein